MEGDAASTSLGFSKHFNFTSDLETFFFFNRPRDSSWWKRGSLWFFPSLLVLIDPAPQSGVSLTPGRLPVMLSPTGGCWQRRAHLAETGAKGIGRHPVSCRQLPLAEHFTLECLWPVSPGGAWCPWKLASLILPVSSL